MSTSKRTMPTWLLSVLAFLVVMGAVVGGMTLFTGGDDKTTPPTASAPEEGPKKDDIPQDESKPLEKDPQEAFGRLTLPLLKEWASMAVAGAPETSRDYVDTTECDQSTTMCPSLSVHNLKDPYFADQLNEGKPLKGMLTECGAGDNPPSERVDIDGEKALHYAIDCDGSMNHIWVVPTKHVEFVAIPGEANDLNVEAVEQMVMTVTWK